jgi:hypothetical protein
MTAGVLEFDEALEIVLKQASGLSRLAVEEEA